MSIFDDLRNKYLELYKNTGYLSNEFEQKERRKFFPPSRPNNELREQNMRYKIALMQFYGDFGNA